ncbi:hypothetical protein AAU57_08765 [Nonlabens sp. YIK11]|uniref:hypothetical protein n=1 Tax=Nonlabens sp. YIK11 TaxID=1453349 RepID=UPI0006DCD225|nr:hypothetical protein [Nonlabens sp. YIK11]KQC33394.1 hypothetical protein AAU57_08765 [Nonlabens sp. YIK11]
MPEVIKIAELAIDNKKLISELTKTKKAIDELSQTQKELKRSGDTSSETFIENEAALKSLKSEYNKQQKVLQATTQASEKLTKELNKEVRSVDMAVANNKELRTVRNQLNTETKEGADALKEINDKINENTEYINENGSDLEQLKNNVGNYKEGITDAFQEINIFNGGLAGFSERAKAAGGTTPLLINGLKGMASGFLGLAKASLTFIATPVGAVLAVLVGAFLLVKNAMNRSEESTNKITKVFSVFTGFAKKLLQSLEPLGEFIIDGIVKGFELAEKAIYETLETVSNGLAALGLDKAAEDLRAFNKAVQENAVQSKALADAEAKLTKGKRELEKIQKQAELDAEKQRQIRDDETKSTRERIKANEDLGKILKNQAKEETAINQLAIDIAKQKVKQNGANAESLDELAEAELKLLDTQERINSQESEQLVNRVAIQKEAADKAKEYADKAIARQQAQLDLLIAEQGIRAKTLEEQLEDEKVIAEKSIEILKAELKNKNILQEEYETGVLEIKQELARRQAEIAVDNAEYELEQYKLANQSKIDSDKYFSDEALRIEEERLNAIAEKQREFEQLRLEEGVSSQTEYNRAINAINEENRIALEEAELARNAAIKEKELEDLENKKEIDAERREGEIQLAYDRLEQDRLQEVEAAQRTGASIELINEKYAARKIAIDEAVKDARIAASEQTLGAIAQLLGKQTRAGKAAGIAQATINSYLGFTEVLGAKSVLPEPFGSIQKIASAGAIVTSGLQTVKKIASTDTKFARGGLLSGRSHSQGGIKTPYGELEGGEAVINKRSTSMFAPILSALNEAGGGVKFANGGILGNVSIKPSALIDYDVLASKIADSNRSLPSPRVSVDEISRVSNNVSVIEASASF